jgi:hypothetical protein
MGDEPLPEPVEQNLSLNDVITTSGGKITGILEMKQGSNILFWDNPFLMVIFYYEINNLINLSFGLLHIGHLSHLDKQS